MQSPTTVAQTIIDQLHEFGVEYIFGVSGDAILDLLHSLAQQSKIKFISTRHESAAGFMASSYAKLTGKLGVCVATSGPGMANLLNGLGDAYSDKVPVLAITGQVPTPKIGTEAKQYVDQQRFIEPLAAYSGMVSSPDSIIQLLDRAVRTAIKQKAVTHLSVPKDLFSKTHTQDLIPENPFLYRQSPSDLSNLSKAAQFLNQCNKPMIYIGRGAQGCRQEIRRLAERLGAGVVSTLGAKGIIPESYEFMLGGIGEGGSEQAATLLNECDGLLMIGAMWYPKTFMSTSIPFVQIELEPDHIHFDKNLYTALIGDAQEILGPLENQITRTPNALWLNQIHSARAEWLSQMSQEQNDASTPIAPARIMSALSKAVNSDAIITLDTGDHTVWFNRSFQTDGQELLFSGTWRTLGFGLPAANAAQLLYPEKQVVAVVGDGGFAMNLSELATTVAYRLPVKMVVLNNSSLAMEKNKMKYMGLDPFGADLVNPLFSQVAVAFGIPGIRVDDPNQLDKVITESMQTPGPVLIEVISSTQPTPLSKVKAAVSV
ncbi:thiamine pyrophosphate-binding protein [Ammoniphilus sp. CFH 90114]|uniref:thiamine pyrophosphate-binding protein n=1 Tax=Ammoniphilus sp. CFH 90114 TaxID=2493665 RepID=UPI0013E91D02|nr:thiamine pyrophosphate-binding protein [Ammoniphilus sp. CFH 90114]